MDIIKNLSIESDHIGLYPRKGNAEIEGHIPLLYILTIPEGDGTINITTDHPLTAPIRKQLKDGSPGGNWRYLAAKKGDSHFIFGALTLSAGNRLLFFPSNYDVPVSVGNETKNLDHVSLESNTKLSSHYTFRNGSHLSNGPVKDIGSNFSLWFSIFIGDLSQYIPLPNKIQVSIDWPSSDVSRFSGEGVLTNYKPKSIVEVPAFVDNTPLHQIDFMLAKSDVDIANIPDLTFENIHSSDQPTPTQSGFAKIDVFEEYSLFIRITERNGQLEGDTLVMSAGLE